MLCRHQIRNVNLLTLILQKYLEPPAPHLIVHFYLHYLSVSIFMKEQLHMFIFIQEHYLLLCQLQRRTIFSLCF
ncbi:hypothetical protein V5799_004280 [Amblyomma americanum]|uniref:Uncharacterized protein n=1 Tax=Amblyomma americanum TaxID=6943 RepID=A0AAQ4D6J8_AMBAM